MLKRRILGIAIILVVALVALPALANTPTEQIQQTIQQVMEVVGNSANGEEQRKNMLREALMPSFDWLEMSKQALGKHWRSAAGREEEFVAAFAHFLSNAYVGQIASYRNEKVLFVQESVENNRAQVKTKILADQGEPTAIDYHLHRTGGEWKIYDVVIADISIVANYRAQFNRILAKGSLDDLLKQLAKHD